MPYVHSELVYKIRGVLFNVRKQLGTGLAEELYQKALSIEFKNLKIFCEKEKAIKIFYKNEQVGDYRADLYINNLVPIELKSVDIINPKHKAQLICYMKGLDSGIGILANYGSNYFEPIILRNVLKGFIVTPKMRVDYGGFSNNNLVKDFVRAICLIYKSLGAGYLEQVYYNALAVELGLNNLNCNLDVNFSVKYLGQPIEEQPLKLIVENKIFVVVKAVGLLQIDYKNYIKTILKNTNLEIGIIVNFGISYVDIRIISIGKELKKITI
ncbi:MAG: GxxExxY protein [bacterium]